VDAATRASAPAFHEEDDLESINYIAVLAAAASTFAIGGLWYSPLLFQRAWMEASNLTARDLGAGGTGRIFGLAFIFALLMAFNLAMFLNAPGTTAAWGATAGLLSALWVVLGIGTIALFERRPAAYTLVNGGYWIVAFAVMGTILGAWR
jgi:hypothetical protein